MEWIGIVVAAGVAWFGAKWWRGRQYARRKASAELEAVRRLADEDVARLGELLQQLDREIAGRALDEQTQASCGSARDSFESARLAMAQVTSAEGVSGVTETVAKGRYALACTEAGIAGLDLPEKRPMCFFDPQHGVAVSEVLWHRPGHGARRVPACSPDRDRVANRTEPELRTVRIGARTMPYWSAGTAFLPYTTGYFAGVASLAWALQTATVEEAPDSGHFGTGIVGSSGNFDGGGFDGSGGGH